MICELIETWMGGRRMEKVESRIPAVISRPYILAYALNKVRSGLHSRAVARCLQQVRTKNNTSVSITWFVAVLQ